MVRSNVHHLEEIQAAGLETPAVNQIELHPWCQQRPIVSWCRAHDVVVQAYTPLVRGKPSYLTHPVVVTVAQKVCCGTVWARARSLFTLTARKGGRAGAHSVVAADRVCAFFKF